MELCDKIVCTVCYYSLMACVALNQQGGKKIWTETCGIVLDGGSVLDGKNNLRGIVRNWKSCLGQLRT